MVKKRVKNTRSKKFPAKWIVLIVVAIIVIGLLVLSFIIPFIKSSEVTGDVVKEDYDSNVKAKNCYDVQVPYEDKEEYLKTEYYNERVPYSDRECESKNLVYSATNAHWVSSNCNSYNTVCYEPHWYGCSNETKFCADKTLTYSVDINNLDDEAGSWTVDIIFSKGSGVYRRYPLTYYLYPKTSKTFEGTIRVTGNTPQGDANQDFYATYQETSIPTKQVCRDVIKYQDVQRERQVTAYKPVTKYRTEQKCE